MSELLPCPFCGGTDIRINKHPGAGRGPLHEGENVHSMCCYNCGATFPNRYRRELLVECWNRRANPAQQDAPRDADDAFHMAALDYRTAILPQEASAAYERLEAAARARYAPAQDAEDDASTIQRMGGLLAGVAVALKGPEQKGRRHGYQDLPELARKVAQDAERERDAGIEAAARWIDTRRDDFDREHGYEDPDTGAWEYGTGPHAEAKREYSFELAEIAEGLRALKSDAARAQRAVPYWLCCGARSMDHSDKPRQHPDCFDIGKAKYGTAEEHSRAQCAAALGDGEASEFTADMWQKLSNIKPELDDADE